MNKLKALQAFEDQDGKFAEGDEFIVNDERAFVLIRTGKAERVTASALTSSSFTQVDAPQPQFGVPRQREGS